MCPSMSGDRQWGNEFSQCDDERDTRDNQGIEEKHGEILPLNERF